jgi:SAM-dependent methyltransferase
MTFPFRKKRSLHSPPTRNDVLLAYWLILGREPEDESVIQFALKNYKTIEQLSDAFQSSEEFGVKITANRSLKSPPSRNDVLLAFRLILEREPGDEGEIRDALKTYKTVDELSEAFQHSDEFARKIRPLILQHRFPFSVYSGIEAIEVSCDSETMSRLLAHIEKSWSQFGAEDPYWSVLSHDTYHRENFEEHEEAFWNSGESDVLWLQRWMERNQLTLPDNATCLEYGCGTGRVTRWLAQKFDSVVACDISETHMQIAREAIPLDLRKRVTFVRIDRLSKLDELPPFDVLFSIIVLQHNPPPVIAYVLDGLLQRLRPGGVACFQVPTFQHGYRFAIADYIAAVEQNKEYIEMHVLPQRYVFEIAARHGCVPVEVNPDNMVGHWETISTTFLFRKLPHE